MSISFEIPDAKLIHRPPSRLTRGRCAQRAKCRRWGVALAADRMIPDFGVRSPPGPF